MIKKLTSFLVLIASTALFAAACGPSGPVIEVSEAWVRPDPLWENAAGYFLITNRGDEADYLLEVQVDFAESSKVHESLMEGDVHKMIHRERVEIPAGGKLEFKPLSFHLMLTGLDQGLALDQEVTMVLVFEKSGEIEVRAVIAPE